jgi:hypothetical protein
LAVGRERQMVGIVLSEEQIRSAPSDVRRWLAAVVEGTLQAGHNLAYDRGGFRYAEDELAICDPQEILQIFSALRNDATVCQIFFGLGKDNYDRAAGGHTAIPIADEELIAAAAISAERLEKCLVDVNRCLRSVRNDPRATLFVRDQSGRVVLHERTQWNIHMLLQHLVAASRRAEAVAHPYRPVTCAPPYALAT